MLVAQTGRAGAELLVVDNSTDGTGELVRRRFPDVRLVRSRPSALIPHLWEEGIRQSRGRIVAITTAHCVPREDWVDHILRAHAGEHVAVGGAIENDRRAGPVDWAVYFCRYTPFMLPFAEGPVPEIPGDNASYRRTWLDRCDATWRNGFWEPDVHAELKKAGARLWLTPSIVVYHKRSFGLRGFVRQRFHHGMHFGGARARRLSLPKRLLYAALSPAIPVVLVVRIVKRVAARRRHAGALLGSLPFLVLFLLAWTLGELIGYLRGRAE